ncbi:MAG TPA: MFS transporter, partial [Hellea balneolensis]|nr:MFS transporter [Hellea balneolensis]
AFEETVLTLSGEGLIHGPAHCSNGQEGGAVGAMALLDSRDKVNGTHRAHHQFLAKTLNYHAPDGMLVKEDFPDDIYVLLRRTLAEIMGLEQGFCGGRGGSMHLFHHEAGMIGTNAIVGGGVPLASGAAWAEKHSGGDGVVVTFFSDGAANIGAALETMNLAAAWKLPLCFFIENNQYAVSTNVSEATGEPRLSARGPGFGMPAYRVDGMDPLAVMLAMDKALEHMRAGHGPVLIEADTYRFTHQAGALPGSAFGYRTKEEEALWNARDPLDMMAKKMSALGLIKQKDVENLRVRAQEAMNDVVSKLTEDADGKGRQIIPSLWPDAHTRMQGIRGDLSELAGTQAKELEDFGNNVEARKFITVIAKVMDARMAEDDRIFTLGEDVHNMKGGTNGATKGLVEKYPGRILGTPIAEEAFCGLAGGVAMDGRYRPVIEIMYADFMWVAADQIFNQIAKARFMYGGKKPMPVVLRSKTAIGTGYGTQHSMDPTGIYATSPGWRIVAPSTPFDYIGLMNTALKCDDPVLVLEHVALYNQKGLVPVNDYDYFIPFGKARVARSGRAFTVLTFLTMVQTSVEAADNLGIDAEIIDLRTLDRASLDWETIGDSIRKTNNVLIVEQGPIGTSYGNLLVDEIQKRFFDELDQPIKRVVGGEESTSVSKVLEQASIPGITQVEEKFIEMQRDVGINIR